MFERLFSGLAATLRFSPFYSVAQVRLQEFLELVKAGDRLEAVRHAKKHLASEEQVDLVVRVQF